MELFGASPEDVIVCDECDHCFVEVVYFKGSNLCKPCLEKALKLFEEVS